MSRVLFTSELGTGYAHIRRLLSLARSLQARGHEPFFAVRNPHEAWDIMQGSGFPVFATPQTQPRRPNRIPHARTLSELLLLQGFDDPNDILPLVFAWRNLMLLVAPQLVVTDFSPAASLTVYRARPVVTVGDGFTVPPSNLDELPPLAPNASDEKRQQRIVEAMHQVQESRKRPAPPTLSKLFAAGPSFPCTFPELDPYLDFRQPASLGPLEPPSKPSPPPVDGSVLVSLSFDYPKLNAVANILVQTDRSVRIHLRRGTSEAKNKLRKSGVEVIDRPTNLNHAVRSASIVVHQGDTDLAEAAIALGRPQLLLPHDLPQRTMAQRVDELGIGIVLQGQDVAEQIPDALQHVSGNSDLLHKVSGMADALADRSSESVKNDIVERCDNLIRASSGSRRRLTM